MELLLSELSARRARSPFQFAVCGTSVAVARDHPSLELIMNAIAIASALSSSISEMSSAQIATGDQREAAQEGARLTREQSKANTRERLLAAARSVFASSGFHGASVEEIA